jgi:hypothetical protein
MTKGPEPLPASQLEQTTVMEFNRTKLLVGGAATVMASALFAWGAHVHLQSSLYFLSTVRDALTSAEVAGAIAKINGETAGYSLLSAAPWVAYGLAAKKMIFPDFHPGERIKDGIKSLYHRIKREKVYHPTSTITYGPRAPVARLGPTSVIT